MTPDQTAALLAQILAHPRVKAYGEARGWWTNDECEQCSGYGDIHGHNGVGQEFQRECDECDGRGLIPRYTGPDLALDSNLHELLALADAIDVDLADYALWTRHNEPRTLAVLAALRRALGIDA